MKCPKKTLTVLVPLLSGNKKRIYKRDIQAVHLQQNIEGGDDVQISTKSGQFILTTWSYNQVMKKIWGEN
ncbi:MAG: hypothetical protein KHX55_02390 [Proteobacteria bacterium]|nr:hypothetical protein [Pseudomonadota bacterium]